MFGQGTGFGQTGAGSAFGQGATGQQAPGFGTTGQQAPGFGTTGQQAPGFSTTGQQAPGFGTTGQQAPGFGTAGQQAPGFGTTGQSSFGATNQPVFGSAGQTQTGFGNTIQPTSAFGATTSSSAFGGSSSVFGATTISSAFGGSPQVFGATTSSSAFGGSPQVFGATASSSAFGGSPSVFGTVTNTPTFSDQGSSSFGNPSTVSSSGFGQTLGFGVTSCTSSSTFGGTTAFGTGTTTLSPAFGSGQRTSASGFGSVTTTGSQTGSQAFGGVNSSTTFGGSGSFGGSSKATSIFSSTSQPASSAFGSVGQSTSSPIFASSNQTTHAFGAAGQGSLVFGAAGQSGSVAQGSSFGGTSQGSSIFGGTSQGSSAFGGTGQGGSTFGGAGQGGSTFGGTGQGSSIFVGTGQGSSTFGGAGQGSSTFGGPDKSSTSIFGGQTTSVFGSSTEFGTITTAQGQTAPGQQTKVAGATTSLFGGTSTTSVFGGASKTSSSSLFGGRPQTGSTTNPASFVGVTGDIAKQLHPPRTTFVTKTTQSKSGVDTKCSGSGGTSAGPQDQGLFGAPPTTKGTDVSARGSSSKQLFGKTDNESKGAFGKSGASDTRKLGRKTSDDTDEAPRAKRTTLRRLSSVSGDMSDKIVIVCRNVPAKYNNARNLRSHFCKFGEVKRTFPNPKRQQATIHFSTHEEAASAKRLGSRIDSSMNPMEIFWGRHSVTSPVGQKQTEESTGRAGEQGKRRATDVAERGRPSQSSKWLKSEVDDELSNMAGTSDVSREVTGSRDRVVRRPVGQTRPTRNLSPVTRTRQSSPAPASPSTSTEDVKIGKAHTFFMSKADYGKKVVTAIVLHRTCSVCKWWKRNRPGVKVRDHRCVHNHSGSARSMESAAGVQGIQQMSKDGTPVEVLEGDGDNTLISKLRSDHGINMKKRLDKNHVIKNIGKSLYALHHEKGVKLSKNVIIHIQKCLRYCFAKNQVKPDDLCDNLTALIPHQFGDHSKCKPVFCGFLRKPNETYRHRSLPYKSALKDSALRHRLELLFEPIIARSVQYSDLGSSQQCEHANKEVTLRAPKSHHYGASDSLDFRVQATSAFINDGRNYIAQVNTVAGISPGLHTEKYAAKRQKRRLQWDERRKLPSYKRRRLQLKEERSVTQCANESLEGDTYQSDSLRTLTNSVGHSVADKIQILKLRDKIVRHGRTKQPSLATARAFVGNCPDMCPEMERYDRQEKRRLHPLEILQGTESQPGMNPLVDHLRAVKEYSRSSADQEEPLPYELRPISVLVTTMNYLLNEIADRGSDGTWGDWFDFLWNRMRGIRKDITQQQLCDIHTAELLEKCVRFHVFCAERLCEEDMFSFDEKINNENMTKCLQTLKELYHDLLKKHNTFCQNEAEIRAYMILMNLNQGDILRETQQLRAEVRNSVHIRFALQVYSALNSHNYVRFFRLVRHASYLNACIMHRYFTQVRGGALKRILFTCGKGNHEFAVDNLVRILAFENNTEAAEFCKFYGLRANNSTVILNRSSLIQPENNWLPRRAERLIESKRLVSIGEVINGEALKPVNLPAPSFSFDENGKFMASIGVSMKDIVDSPSASTLTTEVDSRPTMAPPPYPGPSQSRPGIKIEATSQPVPVAVPVVVPVAAPVVAPPTPPQQMKVSNLEVKECAKMLFWEVIDEFCGQVSREMTSEVQTYLDQSHAIVHSLMEEVLQENVSALSIAYYNEIQVLRQRQLKQEREATLKRALATIVSEVIKDVTNQELLNLATAKVREVKAELKEQQKARCSEDIRDELLEDVLGELVQSVSADVYQKDVVERLEKLADIEKCVQLRTAGRFLQVWKKEFSARQKLKRGMLTFPSAPGLDTAAEQIDMLIPDRREDGIIGDSFSISTDARLSLASSIQLSDQRWVGAKLLSAHELYQSLCHCKAWQPFDIAKLVGGNVQEILQRKLKGKLPPSVYWKLVLSLPDPDMCDTEEDKNATGHLNTWLRSKFSKSSKARGQEEVLSLYKADLSQDDDKSQCKLCVCVRAVQGARLRRGRRGVEDLMGVSGIILTLPPGMEDSPDSTYWRRVRQRLDGLLEMKPSDPAVSLVILCPVSCDQSMVTDDLVRQNIMDRFLSLDKVSNVYILDIDYRDDLEQGFDLDSLSLSAELGEAVQWLGEEYPNTPQLCVNYIRDFIDTNLHKHFYSPVLYNLKQRKVNGCLHQRPSDLLTLYNAVIQHLEAVVTSPRLLDLSWPVPEFSRTNAVEGLPTPYWNDEDHLEYLSGIVHEMELPWLQDIDLENTDWSEVCDEIWAFVRSVAGDDQGSAKVDLVSKMRLLLKTVRRDFEDTCYLIEGENRCEPSFENVPWTDVITACIEYRMASVSFTDPQMDDTEEEDKELKVVYFEDQLKSYKPPDTWTYLESHRDITGLPSLNHTVQTAVEKAREVKLEQSRTQDRIQDSIVTSSSRADIDLDPLSQEEMAAKEDTRRLLETVKAERRESQKFDRYLQRVLNECDTDTSDQTFDRGSPLFFSPNRTTPAEFMDASGIEPSLFADCITPRRYSTSDRSRVSDFRLLDTSTADQSALASVEVSGVSDKLTKLQEEIVLYRRSSDIFEQKLQMLIDDGI